jgi:hypothetical protein
VCNEKFYKKKCSKFFFISKVGDYFVYFFIGELYYIFGCFLNICGAIVNIFVEVSLQDEKNLFFHFSKGWEDIKLNKID